MNIFDFKIENNKLTLFSNFRELFEKKYLLTLNKTFSILKSRMIQNQNYSQMLTIICGYVIVFLTKMEKVFSPKAYMYLFSKRSQNKF